MKTLQWKPVSSYRTRLHKGGRIYDVQATDNGSGFDFQVWETVLVESGDAESGPNLDTEGEYLGSFYVVCPTRPLEEIDVEAEIDLLVYENQHADQLDETGGAS